MIEELKKYIRITNNEVIVNKEILKEYPNYYDLIKDYLPKDKKVLSLPTLPDNVNELLEYKKLRSLIITSKNYQLSKQNFKYLGDNSNIKTLSLNSDNYNDHCKNEDPILVICHKRKKYRYKNIKLSTKCRHDEGVFINLSKPSDVDKTFKFYRKKYNPAGKICYCYKKNDITALITIKLNNDRKSIKSIWNFPRLNSSDLREIVDTITNHYNVDKLILDNEPENDAYPDLEKLLNLKKVKKVEVAKSNIEDFLTMREAINYYVQLINQANLSVAEKVTFAYDIVKSYTYKMCEEEYDNSANLVKIIKTGYIVCAGFAKMYEQILNELNIPNVRVRVDCLSDGKYLGHCRNLVSIDDDKYDIHGIFVCDPTFDCAKENYVLAESLKTKEIIDATGLYRVRGRKLDGLVLYGHFLVPASEYHETFGDDTTPRYLDCYFSDDEYKKYDSRSHLKSYLYSKEENYENFNFDLIDKYIDTKKPSLETFNKILSKVRLNEGYAKEEIQQEIEWVEEVNSKMYCGKFFTTSKTKQKTYRR